MPEISSFIIDTSYLAATKTTRGFSIDGEAESRFIFQVVNDSGAYYNWKTKTFNTGHISENNLISTLRGTTHKGDIIFPSSSSATYNAILIAPPDSGTTFSEDIEGGGKNVVNKTITQVGDVTVTFAASTANTASYGNATTPADEEDPPAANITSTGSPTQAGLVTINDDFTVYNRNTDANGFGLRLTRQPVESDWYFTTTETVDGAVSSSKTVVVDDLTDLVVGMVVTAGTGLSGTPTITEIGTSTKTIVLSSAQSFDDGITLTFQARGEATIASVIGIDWKVIGLRARAVEHSVTVRSGVTNATIPITNTYGIAGGSHVTVTGAGINTSGTNNINSVAADAGGGGEDGTITMDLSSTVTTGTVLYLDGSTTSISIAVTHSISTYPSANRTIYLNLDNFITPGAAS